MPMTTICLRCGRPYFRAAGHKCRRRSFLRLPRTRAARLAAELADLRDAQARTEDTACAAAARIDEIFAVMDERTAAAGLPRPRHGLHLVRTDDGRPGAA